MSTYLTTAFVLGVRPWRERDRLYRLMTATHGKVELIAAGTRHITSKLAPHLLPFAQVEVMVAHGKQLDRLASVAVQQVYLRPPYPMHLSLLGQAMLEAADCVTELEVREPKIHELLVRYLTHLQGLPSEGEGWRPLGRWLLASYLVELLSAVGLQLKLTRCQGCQGELTDPAVFSWTKHEFFHTPHAVPGDAVVTLSSAVVNWFKQATTGGVKPEDGVPPAVLSFLADYVAAHTGRPLNTLAAFRALN